MLGRVVVENGVKKIVPLTADCGSGNPVGTVIAVYSNKVPNGYLPCNGVAFDTAQFPVLYTLLGDDHTPDLRECTLKGIGESGRTVGAHVKAGGLAVGEFVDDRIQNHKHVQGGVSDAWAGTQGSSERSIFKVFEGSILPNSARYGATTEVKAVGVNWCIKATSGINENQADNVLSALSPVNAVTSGDMHAVTSNAVANLLANKIIKIERRRVSLGTISAHSYIIKTFNDMDMISPSSSYIVQIANNITGGAGIVVIGNGQGSVMFFNATNNIAIPTIDIICIWFDI